MTVTPNRQSVVHARAVADACVVVHARAHLGSGARPYQGAGISAGRLGQLAEIARVECFLAADQSACVTGQIRAVNGGLDI
jgi:NAD(P)-dependent dehydrogenase (short-subunit alcohol dehydrogenase family)